jgi:hypothetical protein
MTLLEAISVFIEQIVLNDLPSDRDSNSNLSVDAIELLKDYSRAAGLSSIAQIKASTMRDFLARWYVELASASKSGSSPANDKKPPSPKILLGSLAEFFKWADERCSATLTVECAAVLSELEESLPRTLEITRALSKHLSERGGAFSFPEFLTSFEQGGHSEYDIGEPGEISAIEGYFLIERVEDTRAEGLEIVTDKRAWPIIFPEEVARLIGAGFIINLEIVRAGDSWQIADCGFAFPPNTEVLSAES